MEEDQIFQYTPFPDLNATYQQTEARACLHTHWQGRFSSLSDEVLILAWASLLQAFTRISNPVFLLNGQPITVDLMRKRWTKLQARNILEGGGYPTHLILRSGLGDGSRNDVPEGGLLDGSDTQTMTQTSLYFRYDRTTSHMSFFTHGNVPESFLAELERQMKHTVCALLPRRREKHLQPSTPSLSVLNPERNFLKGPLLLHELISRQWTRSSLAIEYWGSSGGRVQMSYARLNHLTDNLARRIANQLSRDGAAPSQAVIPVYIPQCPELYCAWIAVLKANAAFCPVGLDMPTERMKYILKDVDAGIVLTLPELASKIAEVRPDILIIEVQGAHSEDESINDYRNSERPLNNASSSSIAYVMYTSGSTGAPKGVTVPHNAVTQALLAHDEHVPSFNRFLQFAAPTFDVSVFETFFPLFRGATLVTRHREHMLGDLPGTLRGLAVDAAELTPTVAGTLLCSREAAPSLRLLLTIGEMLTRAVVEEFAEAMDRKGILLPMYGPTEASIHCTVASSVSTETKVGIIGRPLSTVTSLIIRETEESSDAGLEVLPVGQVGELAVAGQLATGYLNRPEQTDRSFRSHPTYGRIYRTGDRARLLPSGDLECLGRLSSEQVKIRGQRVELGEIEQVVCKAQGIQSAAASIIDSILVVFCTASSKHATPEQIRSVCKLWLPSFMQPGDIILLFDNVPRLASGKMDKKELETKYRNRPQATTNPLHGSQSQLEHRIIQCITAEIPSVVSPTDDLWSSGLDSLKAIKVASRLRENDLWLSVNDLLTVKDVAGLAKLLETVDPSCISHSNYPLMDSYTLDTKAAAASLKSVAPNVDMREVEGFRPCSPLQLAMLAETSINSSLNFNSVEIQLPDSVSAPAFQRALQQLAGSNQVLRSGFVRTGAQKYPFCLIIWKRLDPEIKDLPLRINEYSRESGKIDRALLHPLKVQFVDEKQRRTCRLQMHHALYDGWSLELILRDLDKILSGHIVPQRPQFDSVVRYQLQSRLENASEAVHTYWRDHLQDIKPIPFPKMLTMQVQRTSRQACTRTFALGQSALTSISHRLHVSRQSIVSAALAVLLSSYVGNSDVVFGAVSSGRTMPVRGIEKIIGPCISTFPMRLDLSRLRTARDVINSAHRQHHDFLQFDYTTLADIQALSGVAGGDPLFDLLLVWQEGLDGLQTPERVLTIVDSFDSLDYTMVLEVEPDNEKLQAKISFETSKVSVDHAFLFLRQLDSLLALLAQFPECLVKDCFIDLETEDLSIQNADICKFDGSFTLTSTIEALAKRDPSRTAIEFVDAFDPQSEQLKTRAISYEELYLRASNISQELSSKGVSPDDVISIIMEKSVELYVTILGVILSGGAYIAIDPRTPPERVQIIVKDSHSRIVISDGLSSAFAGSFESHSVADLESRSRDAAHAVNPPANCKGGDLAYVVYTSGSTGVPKGVLITRSNVLSNIDCLSRLYPTNSDAKLLQACSQAFDVSVFEIFFTWHMGMSLCVAANDVLFRDIEHLIRCLNISHLSLTPSVAALIEPENVPSVNFLVTAGEPMNSKVFGNWTDRGLYQGYGPSETTNICNVRTRVTSSDFANNVGPPLCNTSIFICQGQDFNVLPRGALGQVWIGGEQVGRGYLHNNDLTRKSFVNHEAYGRLYRSGDVGRLLSDGSLVIFGRDDDQVKLRGQRIELGDIDQALVRSAVVKDSVTLIVDASSDSNARLVSFWTPSVRSPNDTIEFDSHTHALFEDLEARLPAYMIPNVLIPIKYMPLTGQGKIDKRTLMEQLSDYTQPLLQRFTRASGQERDSGPLSRDETLIAERVAELVGCVPSAIHRDASFFGLGIDSLSAIKLSQRLRKVGIGQVETSTILRYASIRRLAGYISSSASTFKQDLVGGSQKIGIRTVFDDGWQRHVKAQFADMGYSISKILPCTPLQEAMLSSYDSGKSDSYQNQLVFRISGNLSELERSWKAMVSRNQLLRTGFVMTESSVSAFAQVVLESFTLPKFSDSKRPEENLDLGNHLREGWMLPPYSLRVSQDAKQGSSILTLRMHHALYDGEAMDLLLREVETHYLRRWLPPTVSFDDYLEYMLSLNQTSIDRFWERHLDGYKPKLVTEVFSLAIPEEGPAHYTTDIVSKVALGTLEAELKGMSTTLLSMVQTSWARLLSFYLQTFDVCFGNVYSGRNIPVQYADLIIGPCFNTLPLRVELKNLQTTADLSRRLQEMNASVLPYQPSSLRRIQKKHWTVERPLFDTLLLLQPASQALNSDIWSLVEETGEMDFPLICEIVPDVMSDQLRMKLHILGTAQVPVTEARRLLENFDLLLQNDIQYTQSSSRDFSVLDDRFLLLPRRPTTEAKSPSSLEASRLENRTGEAFSSLETKIREVLSEASKVDITRIRRATSIFQLGLDSINAVQIAARLRRQGFTATGGEILEASTIEGIAELCSRPSPSPKRATPTIDLVAFDAMHRPQVCQQISFPPSTIDAILPCTSTQSGILAEFVHSNGRFYFNSLTLKLTRMNDVNRLKEAWTHVLTRHEILRTGFVEIESIDHPFGMITYHSGIHPLPWRESADGGDAYGSDVDSETILASLHLPPWCLSYSKQGDDRRLKISILHALYDAQSLNLILADVAALYNGKDLPPPKRIRSTLSFILSQSVVPNNESEAFFTNQRTSLRSTRFPDLRISNNEPPSASVVAKTCAMTQQELRQECTEVGISLQTAAQCAWARVLAAYTGDPDVTFGIVLSGHTFEQTDTAVAFPTMNTLPMVLHVSNDGGDLVKQAATLTAALIQRQFVPLTQIKKWLDMKGNLFDTILVLQQYPSSNDGTDLWEVVSDEAQTEHAASLEVVAADQNSVTLRLTFQRNVLPSEQAKMLLDQYEALLYTTILSLKTQNGHLLHLGYEYLSVLPARQGHVAASPSFLHQMVEQSAQTWPERIALEFATSIQKEQVSKRCWTYQALNNKANKVAHLLLQQGTSPGDLVGICFDKCPEASFAVLGILKAGCAFVAIDPNAPLARKDFILKDSTCTVLLCNRDKLEDFGHVKNLPVLALDDVIDQSWLPSKAPKLTRQLKPEDTCYCLYTSGTTGQPKGCLISHDNAVQALLCFQRIFAGHWDKSSRWLQFASFHFDVSVLEQFWSWSVGICVTSAPRDLLFEDIPGAIRALEITHLDLTPSLARLLKPEEVPSLCRGVFITGGEQLRQDVLDVWGDVGVLYNFYGPSEVTIGCTVHPRIPKSAKPSNIGQQFDNVGTFVLDLKTNQPVLRGAIGELCLSGPLVGKGYLNRPELTKTKFEYVAALAQRIYHTGDLVRLLHDGSFEFLGRADDQVKLRGQRLEIGEINRVLIQSDAELRDVATIVVKHPKQSSEHLVSFLSWSERNTTATSLIIIQNGKTREQIATIRQRCEGKLPGYMIPTYLVPISQMPLSANNKAELNTLKSLFANTSVEILQRLSAIDSNADSIPRASVEKITALISRRFGLAVEEIKGSSSLFELGMDSISVIGFSRSLKEAGFSSAQPSLVMRHPTVSSLAAALQSPFEQYSSRDQLRKDALDMITSFTIKHKDSIARALRIPSQDIEKIAPCTPLQEGMISKTMQSDKPIYAPSFTYDLADDIEVDRLQEAWHQAQSKNEILRTRFVATADGFAQVVLHDSDPQKCFVLSRRPDSNIGQDFQLDIVKDLEVMPWRVVLQGGSQRKVMVICIFHALFDGISLPLLLENVAQLYLGRAIDSQIPGFHNILPFGPLCAAEGAKVFWQKRLASKSLGLLDLPVRYGGNPQRGPSIKTIYIPRTEGFDQLRFKLKVTIPALFHAAWLLVLYKHFGTVPVVGVVVSGRSIDVEGAQNVIGPLFNTLPCLIEFGAGLISSDLVRACHQFNVDSLPFQHTALRDISKWIRHDPSNQLFDSLFVFQKEVDGLNASSQLWAARESKSEPDFPLALEVQQNLDYSFAVTIAAQSEYLDPKAIHALLTCFEKAMHEMVESPDQRLPSDNAIWAREDGKENSLPMTVSSSCEDFVWTPAARKIQQELAALANVEVDAVKANSSIFELGLDSIDAIKLSARLKAADMPLAVSTIMRSATIEALAGAWAQTPDTAIEELPEMRFEERLEAIEQSLITQGIQLDRYEKVLPTTPLQEGILANIAQYYSYDVLELAPDVDLRQLLTSWRTVINSNPILRTSFTEVEDLNSASAYAQLVHRVSGMEEGSGYYHCREVVVSSEPELDDILEQEQLRIVTRGLEEPMLRLMLVRLKTTSKRFLVLGMAHAIYDGWSISLLHQDVACWYSGNTVERPPFEPALWRILNDQNADSLPFWTNTLDKVSPSLLRRHAKNQSNHALTLRKEIRSVYAAQNIQDFCRAQGVTAQALGLFCYSIVLAGLLEQLEVCFGLVLSGRTIENFEEMMFPTMNTVVFPATLAGSRSEMLKAVHSRSIQISEHQFFPLRKAKSLCGVEGDLFDALFIYQKRPPSYQNTAELYHSVRSSSRVQYPVNVEMEFSGTRLIWRAACHDTVLDKVDISKMLDDLDHVLTETLDHPNKPVIEPLANNMVNICGICTFEQPLKMNSTLIQSGRASEGLSTEATEEYSTTENLIREVLALVSGTPEEQISKKTSLFSLGLDSITSIKVSSMLRKKSILLPVSAMLAAPTVEKMATAAMQVTPIKSPSLRPNPAESGSFLAASDYQEAFEHLKHVDEMPQNVQSIMPVTSGQDYVLRMWRASRGRLFYSDFFYQSIDQGMSTERLEDAWSETVRQLSILRTTFIPCGQGRKLLQVVMKSVRSSITWATDQEGLNSRPDDQVPAPNHASVSVPVQLFAKLSSSGIFIRLSIHHALYDAVSLPIIVSTLEAVCRGQGSTVREQSLPPLPLIPTPDQPAAAWQQASPPPQAAEDASLSSSNSSIVDSFVTLTRGPVALDNARAFWTKYLTSSEDLQTKYPASFASRRVQLYRPKLLETIADLEKKCRDHDLSFQSFFLAAYASVHATRTSYDKGDASRSTIVTLGVYLANRSLDIEGLPELAYPTFSVVPLRIDVAGSIFDIADRVQKDLGKIGQVENCGVSLQEIYKWTGVRIDCCVNFLKLPERDRRNGSGKELRFESIKLATSPAEDGTIADQAMPRPSPFTGKVPDASEAYMVGASPYFLQLNANDS